MRPIFHLLSLFATPWALGETPQWINQLESTCTKEQLCALGHGANYKAAAAHARQELAKVFGTKISAKFQLTTTYGGQTTEERVQEDIKELTEQVLEGVQIVRRHQEPSPTQGGPEGDLYVLAKLERKPAGERLRIVIKDLDQRLQSHLKEPKHSTLFQLRRLYNQRATLNQRYHILRRHSLPEKVTWEQINRKQKGLHTVPKIIKISIQEESEPGWITPLLAQWLTGVGCKIAESGFQQHLEGTYRIQRRPLKIEGFEKYRFSLELHTLNLQGQAIGGLTWSQEVVGRNRAQAASKARGFVRDYLREHIDQLNI